MDVSLINENSFLNYFLLNSFSVFTIYILLILLKKQMKNRKILDIIILGFLFIGNIIINKHIKIIYV